MGGLGKNKFVSFGLPVVLLTILGSFGIKEFAELRIEHKAKKTHALTASEIQGIKNLEKRAFNMGTEFERLQKKVDIDTWEQKRLPRPGESTKDL